MNSGRSFGRHVMSTSVVTWLHDRAVELHRRRDLAVHEVQRHLHVDLAVLVDALEVDVQDLVAERMHLHVAQQHLGGRAVELHVEDRRVERFVAQRVEERVVVELDRRGLAPCRRRRCRGPCRRGACGGDAPRPSVARGNAVNSIAMVNSGCLRPSGALACPVVRWDWRQPPRGRDAASGKALNYNLKRLRTGNV